VASYDGCGQLDALHARAADTLKLNLNSKMVIIYCAYTHAHEYECTHVHVQTHRLKLMQKHSKHAHLGIITKALC